MSAGKSISTTPTRVSPRRGNAGSPHTTFRSSQKSDGDVPPLLSARGLKKSYRKGKLEVPVLRRGLFGLSG
ncbi:MAG: hypothetical protein U0894_03695 [Pirellulales bacterium]